jgi:hypothetical protein
MIRHDLYCPGCDAEKLDQMVEYGCYGECEICGTKMRVWVTTAPTTDVLGSTAEDHTGVLCDPAGNNLTWTSSRERDKKMREYYGVSPRGDKVNGARTEYDPLGARKILFGPLGDRSGNKRGKKHGRSHPAA